MRGHGGEVLQALEVLLGRPDAQMRTRARARALTVSCHLLEMFGDDPAPPAMADEALEIARDLADDAVAADALAQLCWLSFERGDLRAALARIDDAVGLARSAGDPRLIAYALARRAVFSSEAGNLDAAFTDNQEAITLSRATGDNYRLVTTLANLAIDEQATGKLGAARTHLQSASTLADDLGYQNLSGVLRQNLDFADLIDGDPGGARRSFLDGLETDRITGVTSYLHSALLGLALAAGADGDPAVAATLHGVADEHYERAGRPFEAPEAGLRDGDHTRLRAALAAAAAEPGPAAASVRVPLSEREREILALLAGGATDAQIAARLFLSVNTVRSYLERIRDKTGARRPDLVRYAIQAGIEAAAPST